MPLIPRKHPRRVIQALFIAVVLLASAPISAEDYDDEYDYEYEEYDIDEAIVLEPSAESVHDHALEIANSGDLKRALPLFQKAVDLDPMRETFQSNLGVTQMRLNALDDALVSFTKGLRVNPSSTLIEDNLKALRQHMQFRAEQLGGEDVDISTETDDYYDDDYDDEDDVVASAPSQGMPVKEAAPLKQPTRNMDALLAGGPDEWFGSWWKKRAKLMPQFRDALVNFRPIQIRNFLAPEAALALHQELYASKDFELYEAYHRWYQFHFKAIYQQNRKYSSNVLLSKISAIMDLPEVKAWVRDMSESEVNGTTLAGASYYAPGDYTMPHTDKAGSSHGEKEKRRIAYILHLTKEWNPKFGGDMIWMNPSYHIHPSFNSMTFFAVSESSWHFVSPVASICPTHVKRLAFSGWWTSTNIRQADAIESKKNDELRFSTFATVIEGKTGRSIPHLEAYEKLEGLWPKLLR